MGPRTKKLLGSQGLGQRSLTTAWLAVATGIYFHKQGREMFFIPYLSVWSVSFAVFLVLSWARKTCKHAPRVSRQQEHTQSGVDANCVFRKAANAWLVPFSSLHSHCVYLHASFSVLLLFHCLEMHKLWSFRFFSCVIVQDIIRVCTCELWQGCSCRVALRLGCY